MLAYVMLYKRASESYSNNSQILNFTSGFTEFLPPSEEANSAQSSHLQESSGITEQSEVHKQKKDAFKDKKHQRRPNHWKPKAWCFTYTWENMTEFCLLAYSSGQHPL